MRLQSRKETRKVCVGDYENREIRVKKRKKLRQKKRLTVRH